MSRRGLLAVLCSGLTLLAALAFLPSPFALPACSVLPGACCALIAQTPRRAVASVIVATACVFVVTLISGYANSDTYWWSMVTALSAGSGIAFTGAAMVARDPKRWSRVLVIGALATVLCCMWYVGFANARTNQLFPFDEAAVKRDMAANGRADHHLYLQTHVLVAQGENHYLALVKAADMLWPGRPASGHSGAIGFRQPLLSWLWAVVAPSPGLGLPALLLGFGTVATLSAYRLCSTLLRRAVSLAGASAVAALFAAIPGSPQLLHQEIWAGALALAALGSGVVVLSRPRDVPGALVAATAALAAALIREHAVVVIMAGVLAWWWPGPRRRSLTERSVWLLAALSFAGLYAWHLAATGRPLWVAGAGAAYAVFTPLLPLNVLTWGTTLFAGAPFAWLLVASAGVVAPLLLKGRERVYAVVAVTVLTLAICSIGPKDITGGALSYWGGLVAPLVLACAPLALLLIPEAKRPVPDAAQGRAAVLVEDPARTDA